MIATIRWYFCVSILVLASCSQFASDSEKERRRKDAEINSKVAEALIRQIDLNAEKYLCIVDPLVLTVRDLGNGNVYANRPRVSGERPIRVNWHFETNSHAQSGLKDATNSDIEYFLRPSSPNQVLMHEFGHAIFYAKVQSHAAGFFGYGTVAPDWLDEAAAILFETDLEKTRRISYLFRDREIRFQFDVAALLNAKHPHQNADIAFRSHANSTAANTDMSALEFYSFSYLFTLYLIDRSENDCIVSELGRSLDQDTDATFKALFRITNTQSRDKLQLDFEAWLAASYPDFQHPTTRSREE